MTDLFPIFMVSFAASLILVWVVIHFLRRRVILDIPLDGSSHGVPVPRGGGLAVMPVIFGGILWAQHEGLLMFPNPLCWMAVLGSAMALVLLAWVNDKRKDGVARRYRLTIQTLAVAIPLFLMPEEWRVFPELMPLYIERLVMAVLWIWLSNLYNFMDGINGITGTQTVTMTLGIVALVLLTGLGMESGMLEICVMIAGAVSGFLFWNARPQAQVFLGDMGSVGLGYMMGWILILLAVQGYPAAAIILPMYYLADATITAICRRLEGKRIWQAHREHFYQRAVHGTGLAHLHMTLIIALMNIMLILTAMAIVLASITPLEGVGIAILLVAALLFVFQLIGGRATRE